MYIIVGIQDVWGGGYPMLCDCGTLTAHLHNGGAVMVDDSFLGWGHAGYSHDPARFPTIEEAKRVAETLKTRWRDWRPAVILNETEVVTYRKGAVRTTRTGIPANT